MSSMSSVKYAITTIVIVCALILIALTAMGPKIGLQTPPIEPKAMDQLTKMNVLKPDETLQGYKATSYYSYKSGIVITSKRIFAFYHDKVVRSIPLDHITMVIIKDTELGHQEVLVSAQADGVIGIDLHHSDVDILLNMLHVSPSIVKHYTKADIRNAISAAQAAPAAAKVPAAAPAAMPKH